MTTPTTREINDNIIAQLEASFSQAIPILPKSFLRVLARVIAGVFVTLHKYGGFMLLQMFVRTASDQPTSVNGTIVTPLTFWGRLVGAGDPAAATHAELTADVTVEVQTGTLPSGSQLVSTQNGVTYITIGDVLLDAAVVSVSVRAASDQSGGGGAGTVGNLEVGATLSFANPLANVGKNATVTTQTTVGAEGETTENYRQRVLDRFQKRPQGGAPSDYELWGEEPASIKSIYPYKADDPGEVDVYVEAVATGPNPDGIPTTAQLEEVLESINFDENGLASRRPVNSFVNVLPIARTAFDVTVTDLVVGNLAQVQAGIDTASKEYFLAGEPFISGLSALPRRDRLSRTSLSAIISDIVNAAGGTFTAVILELAAVPIEGYTLGIGEKAKSNDVQFT
jgi:uncharacterized phage protein gp47/JayE